MRLKPIIIAIAALAVIVPSGDSQGATQAPQPGAPTLEGAGPHRFKRFGAPVKNKSAPGLAADPGALGAQFLAQHGAAFGLPGGGVSLTLASDNRRDPLGYRHITFEQRVRGVPVFAGILRLHYDRSGQLLAAHGALASDVSIDTTPRISAAQAISIVAALAPDTSAQASRLVIYRAGLEQGIAGATHLAYAIIDRSLPPHWYFVDAHSGRLIDDFVASTDALTRRVYESSIAPGNLLWQEGNALPFSGASPAQSLNVNWIITGTRDTYNFFLNSFGRLSYDDADHAMTSVNNISGLACPNANWNSASANFCNGMATDDVVAHEWAHAYTEYTSGLLYRWQAGALNESFSDIWGETVDQINGTFSDTPGGARADGACANGSSLKWLIGEDSSLGVLRDMWSPNCMSHPGKVSDTQYKCGPDSNDNGGVHSNSGVPNHAYALLQDGGVYNGQTISGVGRIKAAHIFWRAQTFYLDPVSGFSASADALEQACADLRISGTSLQSLTTAGAPAGASGQIVSAGDCQELAKVLTAVAVTG